MSVNQNKTKQQPSIRKVIFADFGGSKYQSLTGWLKKDGIVSEAVTDVPKFLSMISEEWFDVCVVNLLLGGMGPFELISNIRSVSRFADIKIIVLSRQVQKLNIQNTIRAGANDFVAEPFSPVDLYNRIRYHLVPKRIIDPLGYERTVASPDAWPYLNTMLEATEILSRTQRGEEHTAFWKILQRIANYLESNRSSLIIVDSESQTGLVLASSDDSNFYDFPISLQNYPEVLHVMHTGQFVLIGDVTQNQMTQDIKDKVRTIAIGSLMVFPVRHHDEVMGVLIVRRPTMKELPSMDTLRVLQALANTIAAHSNMKALLRKVYQNFQNQQKKAA